MDVRDTPVVTWLNSAVCVIAAVSATAVAVSWLVVLIAAATGLMVLLAWRLGFGTPVPPAQPGRDVLGQKGEGGLRDRA